MQDLFYYQKVLMNPQKRREYDAKVFPNGLPDLPNNSNWMSLYGVAILTGIGFTMSLFVGNLAFVENTEYIDGVKIGVLSGSLLSTIFGYFLLLLYPNKSK